jgi:Holliday junction resolvasome RuvABC DNA-binding subunit
MALAGPSSATARAANATAQTTQPTAPAAQVSQEALEQLEAMGFEKAQAKQALIATQNDIQAAIQLLV